MKTKILASGLIFTIILFIILLFIKKEEEIVIISTQKIYSIVRYNIHEEITIPLLVNKESSPYVNIDFISSETISNNEQTIVLPFEITEIRKDKTLIVYNNETYYQYYIDGYINLDSSDYTINIENAYLNILYKDNILMNYLIGEFNITFDTLNNSDLSLSNLEGVFCEINTINTVCGVKIEIFNKTNSNIFIKQINLNTLSAKIPNYYLKEIIYDYETVNEFTNSMDYDHFLSSTPYEQTILLRESTAKYLFFPINYTNSITYLNQFGMEIIYEKNGIKESYIIDDFLFMSTSPFRKEVEQYFTTYKINN